MSGVIVVKPYFTGYRTRPCCSCCITLSEYDADANRLNRQLSWKDLGTQFQIQKAL